MNLKHFRTVMKLSQSRLARISGISRFNIVQAELGERPLRPDEAARIRIVIFQEAQRLMLQVQEAADGIGSEQDRA